MNNEFEKPTAVNAGRRRILQAAGASAVASAVPAVFADDSTPRETEPAASLRWGIVGTGMIANHMASAIDRASGATVAAVSSRKMATAREFAKQHGVASAFDSWEEMLASDEVDAIYVATPTFIREEICVAAATSGKHVLGEKPFANLQSLRRITAACRENDVGFMDGTHFVHHPRTAHIRNSMRDKIGWPWSIASAFQFGLTDKGNIRYNPKLEPYGSIGDAGWYNMRAAVEFTSPDVDIIGVDAYARRDSQTNAVVTSGGIIAFSDGSTTTWNCGFDAGALNMDLRLSGANGQFSLDDFVINQGDGAAAYEFRSGGLGSSGTRERIEVASAKPAAALMFEDFAAMVGAMTSNTALFEASVRASERTQEWLDAVWMAATKHEQS
jgi:predicted dehydrogenase